MNRITQKQLEAVVERINRATGSPLATYTKSENPERDGRAYIPNIGNYHLDGAYGGWKLVRMANGSGGMHSITSGFVPKRELYELMQAMLTGMEMTAKAA